MAHSTSVHSVADGAPSAAPSAAKSFIDSVMESTEEECCELRLLFSPLCWKGEKYTSNSKWLDCPCKQDVVALSLNLFKKVRKADMCINCQTIQNVLAKRDLANMSAK